MRYNEEFPHCKGGQALEQAAQGVMESPALEVSNKVRMWHLQVLLNPTALTAKEVLPPLLVEIPRSFIHSFLT